MQLMVWSGPKHVGIGILYRQLGAGPPKNAFVGKLEFII